MAKKNLCLTVVDGPGKGTSYRLLGEAVVIGRSPECDIAFENTKGVSRRHAQVFVMEDRVRLKDLGSANGTLVEGDRVEEAILVPGVTIKIGAVSLKLLDEDATMAVASKRSGGVSRPGAGELVEAAGREAYPDVVSPGAAVGGAPEEEAAVNPRSVGMLALLLLVIVVGGMYVLHVVSHVPGHDWRFRTVMVNESKVVDFGLNRHFDRWEIEGEDRMGLPTLDIRDYDGLLRPSLTALASNRRAPKRRLVVLRGRSEGDARVRLLTAGGSELAERIVLVRGIIPRPFDESITPQQARELAEKAAAEADVLRADGNLYFAMIRYDFARMLFEGPAVTIPGSLDLSAEMQSRWLDIRNDLQAQLMRIFNEAMAQAFPVDTLTRDANFETGIALLQEAKSLVRDDASLDWQVLDHWQAILMRERRREQGRRR